MNDRLLYFQQKKAGQFVTAHSVLRVITLYCQVLLDHCEKIPLRSVMPRYRLPQCKGHFALGFQCFLFALQEANGVQLSLSAIRILNRNFPFGSVLQLSRYLSSWMVNPLPICRITCRNYHDSFPSHCGHCLLSRSHQASMWNALCWNEHGMMSSS